jgi:integrase/recombinase XerD
MRLFISYARVDKSTCGELISKLQAHEVWYDQKVWGGQRWWDEILKRIEWSEGFIFLLSPEGVSSEYCIQEFEIARNLGKFILPILVRARTEIPDNLRDYQYVDLSGGLTVDSVVELLNAITFAEREVSKTSSLDIENLSAKQVKPPKTPPPLELQQQIAFPLNFNFTLYLKLRGNTINTERAYFRWVERYLEDVAGKEPMERNERDRFMSNLPVEMLHESLNLAQLRAWLGMLASEDLSSQSLSQARAAILALADLLVESELLDKDRANRLREVPLPPTFEEQAAKRWLSITELKILIDAARDMAATENHALRNVVIARTLCTLPIRRQELVQAQWGDLIIKDDQLMLHRHTSNKKSEFIDLPPSVKKVVEDWREVVSQSKVKPVSSSYLVRRVWKGGRIGEQGITSDGIWRIITQAAEFADLGHVSPEDLRRSVIGALYQAGVSLERIRQLAGHKGSSATLRFIADLPQNNDDQTTMDDLLF